ncbi:MAG TPA: DUF4190 domain-containing protein [Arthrobacter sp.]|nr:DUF4190 domain-containing protein [Arthrobacter sp.]
MSDQPTPRPDSEGPGTHATGDSPAGYEPPQFVPPQGPDIPAPPVYGQNQFGQNQYGAGQFGQAQHGQNQYGQAQYSAGQYGAPYAQPADPYGQPPSPYGQPNPYGQPAYYGAPAEPKGLSIASMVCGIASVMLGWFLLPQVAAIITGHLALKREPSGKGMSITGLVLGYLCLLGYGAFWLLVVVAGAMYSTSGYSY